MIIITIIIPEKRAKRVYNLVARKARVSRGPRIVLAACKLGWVIYI